MGRKGTDRTSAGFRRTATSLLCLIAIASSGRAIAAPAVPVIGAPAQNSFVNTASVPVSGTASGDAVLVRIYEGVNVLADTGPTLGHWTANVGLSDGAHTIVVRAMDAASTWSAPSPPRTFTVDTVSPGAPVITVPTTGQVVGFRTVTVEGTAEPGARITVTANSGAILYATANAGGDWMVANDFTDTTHTLTAIATDAAGNESLTSAAVSFHVDTNPPGAPRIFTPGDGAMINTTTPMITGSAEPGSLVRVYEGVTIILTTPASDGTWSGVVSMSAGPHSITARAFDAAGNASPPSVDTDFSVDLVAPGAPTIDTPFEDSFVASPVSVTGSAEPRSSVEIRIGATVIATIPADAAGSFATTLDLSSGPYTINARATDRAGNTGPASVPRTFTADANAPSIGIGPPSHALVLPTQTPLIVGRANDDIGVFGVRLDFYNLLGALTYSTWADCMDCPAGIGVSWQSQFDPGFGKFEVYAYAIDRVGNASLPAKFVMVRV